MIGAETAMEDMKQVFIIYGFLEAGKTQFINFTLAQDYFQMDETTLLIVCEEGIEEYDKAVLEESNTVVEVIEDFEDFNLDTLNALNKKHKPERILIEYNGMWDCRNIQLPSDWEIRQQMTIVDGVTFETYFNNMKSMFADMIRNSELLIMNRCHGTERLNSYKMSIKAINTGIEVVFENEDGEIDLPMTDEDLPYDMKADIIEITEKDYGIWYLDMWDNTDRYAGKRLHIRTMVMKEPGLPKNYFVAGRPAMTCCADDIVFMGAICKSKDAKNLENRDTIDMIFTIAEEYRSDYGGNGPVLYAEKIEKTAPMKEPIVQVN